MAGSRTCIPRERLNCSSRFLLGPASFCKIYGTHGATPKLLVGTSSLSVCSASLSLARSVWDGSRELRQRRRRPSRSKTTMTFISHFTHTTLPNASTCSLQGPGTSSPEICRLSPCLNLAPGTASESFGRRGQATRLASLVFIMGRFKGSCSRYREAHPHRSQEPDLAKLRLPTRP